MKRIFVASRFAAFTDKIGAVHTVEANILRAQRLGRFVTLRGEAPYVPHLYLPQTLNDKHPGERAAGIRAALCFLEVCDETWIDTLYGISDGMLGEMKHAQALGKPIILDAFDALELVLGA